MGVRMALPLVLVFKKNTHTEEEGMRMRWRCKRQGGAEGEGGVQGKRGAWRDAPKPPRLVGWWR